jgi:hypothetical protein
MWAWLSHILYPTYYRSRGKRTVRYAFPLIAVTALFTGLASVTTQTSSYISISTDPTTVREGEKFMIEVKAYAHTPVNAVDISLKYPESQMVIEGIDTGTSVITLWAVEPYAEKGKIYLRGGVFQRGFLGEHTIARIRAHATQSGLAYVNVANASLVAGDGLGTEVRIDNVSENQTHIVVNAEDGKLSGEASVTLVTDLDGNGSVDWSDITSFMAAWLTRGKVYDFNHDGRMTFNDFSILLADSFFK